MAESDIYKTAFRTHHGHFELNLGPTPATFQSLMNDVFKAKFRKGVLVFFDDILVYSKSIKKHVTLLHEVLDTLRRNQLFAKKRQCAFGVAQVEYLGHIISEMEVATDPNQFDAMLNWPKPNTLKELRGFLGLTGYYRKCVRNYGPISKSLTDPLLKGGFSWNDKAQGAFEKLKQAKVSAPGPDFTKPFTFEIYASDMGIGAVLAQDKRPVALVRHSDRQGMSTYEKELMALVTAIKRWRHYLRVKPFVIRTDHESLKHLLQHKLTHHMQHKALTKFIGLDYSIEYKKGINKKVADALEAQSKSC